MLRALLKMVLGVMAVARSAGLAAADPPAPSAPPPPRIEERRPEIFYLQDDAGRLVPVPGFRYRDFVELLRMKEGLPGPAPPPAAVLEEILVQADLGAATGGGCPATVVCTIRQTRRGWVEVPLGCEGLILSRAPRHEGPGQAVVDAAPDRRGYRAWLEATPDGRDDPRHVLTLEGRLPVDIAAGHESLVLHLPPATASAVELRSPRRDPEVVVQPPAPERRIRQESGNVAVVTLAGIAGTATIRVGDRSSTTAGSAVADALVESLVRIDGRDAVTQARIRLENLAEATPTVRIALPPAAALRSVKAPTVLVGQSGPGESAFVDVAPVRGPEGNAVVELECERPLERAAGAKEAGPFELAGFQVEGIPAWRQWGRISLVVEGDWQAVWKDEGLRRVDPPAAGRRPGLVAAFAYDAQPASLKVGVLPRRSRVVIEPEYRYDVSAERVAFNGRLRVAASGAPATGIVVDMDPTLVIDDVGPAGVVDVAGVSSEGGRLTIPFAQPLLGNAVVDLRGGMAVERAAERLSWLLPRPASGLVGPATVVIVADSDIELLPDNDRIQGLVRQTAASVARSGGDDVVLAYRLDARRGEFAATRRYLPRRIDATVAVQAVMDESVTAVTETIRLDVLHVPLDLVELLVPETVLAGGSFEVRQDDVLLDPVEVTEATDDGAAGGGRRLRAILARRLLGGGSIAMRYTLPTPTVPAETTVPHDLPLVLPLEARVTRQSFALEAPDRFSVDVRGDAWRRDSSPPSTAPALRSWSTVRQQASVPLAIAARSRTMAGGLAVDAALLRTALLPDRREDSFTYALSGAAERVELELPGGAVEIRLDGRPAAATPRSGGGVAVELPRSASGRWLLEIRTLAPREEGWERVAARIGLPVRVPLVPPRFSAAVVERRFYWEVSTRPDEWLFGGPASWTSQQRWMGRGPLPQRLPAVSGQSLAAWVRGTAVDGPQRVPPEPGSVDRRAVYSGVGAPGSAAPWLLPTWFLVLVCSGTALTVGLAVLHRAALRRPTPLLALAGAVALAALPGAALVAVSWALGRRAGGESGRGAAAGPPTAGSMTRAAAPPPSLIVAGSSIGGTSGTASGRRPVP